MLHDAPPLYVPGEVLVRFKSPQDGMSYPQSLSDNAAQLSQKTGASVESQQTSSGIVIFKKQGTDAEALANSFQDDPTVEAAQPNYIHRLLTEPLSWADVSGNVEDSDIFADQIWDVSTGKGVVVAVIDSGVDYARADLASNIWTNSGETDCTDGIDNDANGYVDDCRGWDFTGDNAASPVGDNDPMDTFGHGTSVARIIAASGAGSGYLGIAPNAKVMPLKVIDHTGYAPVSAIVEAIHYAIENGADIINMSISDTSYDPFEAAAVAAAYDAGIVLVASAGNEHANTPKYPAANPQVLAVSAVDSTNQAARSSNYGDWIDLAAPGGYTSAATPHVSATAALVLEKFPGSSPAEVGNILRQSAQDLGTPGKDELYGYGLVDAFAALFPPRLALTSQIPNVVETATPTFVLGSTEAGTIDFGGGCSSNQLYAINGQTPIVLSPLQNGVYSDCRLTVTDALGNASEELLLPPFTVDAPFHAAASDTESQASDFVDLRDHWGATFITALVERDVLSGYGDGRFRPDNPITRAEALKIVLLAFDHPIDTNASEPPFADVNMTAWYFPYIFTAKANGIVTGFADGTFHPDNPITRAEALKLVSVAADIPRHAAKSTTSPFSDVPSDAWYFDFIRQALKNGIISGYDDGRFGPDNAITRAEFSKIVALTLTVSDDEI